MTVNAQLNLIKWNDCCPKISFNRSTVLQVASLVVAVVGVIFTAKAQAFVATAGFFLLGIVTIIDLWNPSKLNEVQKFVKLAVSAIATIAGIVFSAYTQLYGAAIGFAFIGIVMTYQVYYVHKKEQVEVEKETNELNSLKAKLKQAESRLEAAYRSENRNVDSLIRENQQLKQLHQDMTKTNAALITTQTKYETTIKQLDQIVKNYQQRIGELEAKLGQLQQIETKYKETVAQSTQLHAQLDKTLNAFSGNIDRFAQENAHLGQSVPQFVNSLKAGLMEFAGSMNKARDEMKKQIADLGMQRQFNTDELKALDAIILRTAQLEHNLEVDTDAFLRAEELMSAAANQLHQTGVIPTSLDQERREMTATLENVRQTQNVVAQNEQSIEQTLRKNLDTIKELKELQAQLEQKISYYTQVKAQAMQAIAQLQSQRRLQNNPPNVHNV